MPSKFRKKPVTIEAMWFGSYLDAPAICDWIKAHGAAATYGHDPKGPPGSGPVVIMVATLEGEMKASVGDFIIRGVQGEFYPCKPGIFAATYEAVPNV